jgi:phage baseplate assembly protein W
MANGKTYGINFPFQDSLQGKYLSLSEDANREIRSNLIHLILTRKGSRYYLPDFGTRIFEFIFEPMDSPTFESIKSDIKDNVEKYIPNLIINEITINPYVEEEGQTTVTQLNTDFLDTGVLSVPGRGVEEYTAKLRIDFTITSDTFETRDFVIINI